MTIPWPSYLGLTRLRLGQAGPIRWRRGKPCMSVTDPLRRFVSQSELFCKEGLFTNQSFFGFAKKVWLSSEHLPREGLVINQSTFPEMVFHQSKHLSWYDFALFRLFSRLHLLLHSVPTLTMISEQHLKLHQQDIFMKWWRDNEMFLETMAMASKLFFWSTVKSNLLLKAHVLLPWLLHYQPCTWQLNPATLSNLQ